MAGAQFAEMPLVEQGQPRGEQLAIDHAFGQPLGDAEADPLGHFGQRLVDPRACCAPRHGRSGCAPRPSPSRGVLAIASPGPCAPPRSVRRRSDSRRTLKVSASTWPIRSKSTKLSFIGVTSVSAWSAAWRANGSSRPGVSKMRKSAAASRRAQLGDRRFELLDGEPPSNTCEFGVGQVDLAPALRSRRDFRDSGAGALARIEIDRGDPRAAIGQRDRDMHRGGRFAGPALFVGEDDAVRGRRHGHGVLGLSRSLMRPASAALGAVRQLLSEGHAACKPSTGSICCGSGRHRCAHGAARSRWCRRWARCTKAT